MIGVLSWWVIHLVLLKKGNNTNQNNANNVFENRTDTSKNTTHTLTSDQYQRLMALLSGTGDTSKAHASVAGTFVTSNCVISFFKCRFLITTPI